MESRGRSRGVGRFGELPVKGPATIPDLPEPVDFSIGVSGHLACPQKGGFASHEKPGSSSARSRKRQGVAVGGAVENTSSLAGLLPWDPTRWGESDDHAQPKLVLEA